MADETPVPPVKSVHAYMRAAGWEVKEPGGPAGCIWVKDGRRIGVPYTDGDAVLIPGVVNRLAEAEGRKPGEVTRDILAGTLSATESLTVSDDTRRDPPAAPEQARERTGPVLPVDREALREIVANAVANWSTGAPSDRITDALWPLLEHAQSAAAGSHEGIRLWMLDCGLLVQKHREHAAQASIRLGEQRERAEAAEAKLGAGDALIRQILEALCRRDGLPLGSIAEPGGPARNYELADRLGIGHVFGIDGEEAGRGQ